MQSYVILQSLIQTTHFNHSTLMCHPYIFKELGKWFKLPSHSLPRSSLFSLEMVFLLWIWSILGSDIFRKWVLNSIVFFLMTKKSFKTQYLFMFVRSCSFKNAKCSLMTVRWVTKQFHSRMMIPHVETSIFYNVRLLWTLEYFLPIS